MRHPDGYIEIKDRSKDIIISGGENISSLEIEETLYRHPKVLEVLAVVARPDETWGEPCAFVTLHGGEDAQPQEIIDFCRENMAHYKAPRTIVFGELPKTSTGKIQKFVLQEKAEIFRLAPYWSPSPACLVGSADLVPGRITPRRESRSAGRPYG